MKNNPQNTQKTGKMRDNLIDKGLLNVESIAKNSDKKIHPNSLKAIEQHQYQKGESGNVGGRPKKYYKFSKSLQKVRNRIITDMRKLPHPLDELEPFKEEYEEYDLGTNKDLVIAKIWELARNGDKQMILLLAEIGALDE